MNLQIFNGWSVLLLGQAPAGEEKGLGIKNCLCSARTLLPCASIPASFRCSRPVCQEAVLCQAGHRAGEQHQHPALPRSPSCPQWGHEQDLLSRPSSPRGLQAAQPAWQGAGATGRSAPCARLRGIFKL